MSQKLRAVLKLLHHFRLKRGKQYFYDVKTFILMVYESKFVRNGKFKEQALYV